MSNQVGARPSDFDPSRGDVWPFGHGVVTTSTAFSGGLACLVVSAVPDGFGPDDDLSAIAAWNEAERIKGPAVMFTFATAASARALAEDLADLAIAMEARRAETTGSVEDDSAAIAQNGGRP